MSQHTVKRQGLRRISMIGFNAGDDSSRTGSVCLVFFFQAEDGIRDLTVTGVQTCALPISAGTVRSARAVSWITIVRPLGTLNVFVTEVPSGKQQMRIVNEVPAGPPFGSTVDPATKGTSGTPPIGMNANSTYWMSSGCPTRRVTNAAS